MRRALYEKVWKVKKDFHSYAKKIPSISRRDILIFMAERQGFEPWMSCPMTVFKTVAFNRSAISPWMWKALYDKGIFCQNYFRFFTTSFSWSSFRISWTWNFNISDEIIIPNGLSNALALLFVRIRNRGRIMSSRNLKNTIPIKLRKPDCTFVTYAWFFCFWNSSIITQELSDINCSYVESLFRIGLR